MSHSHITSSSSSSSLSSFSSLLYTSFSSSAFHSMILLFALSLLLPFHFLSHPSVVGATPTTSHRFVNVTAPFSSSSSFASSPSLPSSSSSVADEFLGVDFDAGYIDVGKRRGEMFYWLFPANITTTTDAEAAAIPTVLWLTGGPGCSSEIAVLNENGPFWAQDDATLKHNPHSWHREANVLYVDQPLGTGFSVARDPRNFVHNEKQIAEDMAQFLDAFFVKYTKLQDRAFYITGESYAGHYIPSVTHYLMFERKVKGLNLQGMAIGNGWVDPYVQYPAYASYALENKIIDLKAYHGAKIGFVVCDKLIHYHLFPLAYAECNKVSNSLIGSLNPYDIRLKCQNPPLCYNMTSSNVFLNKPSVQQRLGVKKKWEDCDTLVYFLLLDDWINDMRSKVEQLVSAKLRVLIYSGDKDYICNWRGGLNWVNEVEWEFASEFRSMSLRPWTPPIDTSTSEPSGEVKRVNNFVFLRIYDAGHMVPMDRPSTALAMLKEFLTGDLPPTHDRTTTSSTDKEPQQYLKHE